MNISASYVLQSPRFLCLRKFDNRGFWLYVFRDIYGDGNLIIDDCDFICTPRHLCRRESKPVDLVSYVFRDIYDGGNLKFQSCGFICTPRHLSQREFEVCRSLTSYVLRDV